MLDEGSVLVGSRSEPLPASDTPSADEVLEPISQVSDYAPQPADPRPETASAVATDQPEAAETPSVEPADEVLTDKGKSQPNDIAGVYAEQSQIKPSVFIGVQPGKTTKDELIAKWGEPAGFSETSGGEVLLYEKEPFNRVDVLVEKNLVEIVRVKLARLESPERIEQRLKTGVIESVKVLDPETGDTMAIAYPEKGLMLLLSAAGATVAPDAQQTVTHLVLGQLEAEAFTLRAENRPVYDIAKRLADLKRAMELDPEYAHAHYLAAELYLATGQTSSGLEAATEAVNLEPDNTAYQVRLAEALLDSGEYDKAVVTTRQVLDAEKDQENVVKAKALHLMGRLASLGDAKISDKAIAFQTTAISMADKLATTADDKDRRAVKKLLVEAHLAVAEEISRRDYDRKTEVVAQWIGRASGLSEELITNDQGSLELRLVVARDALAALANLKPAKDPKPWIDEANETAGAIRSTTDDPLTTARIEWMLGEVYYHAVRIQHTRAKPDEALAYGDAAIKHLMAGAAPGEIRPSAERLVGRLYFHLGAVNAVHNRDHEKAMEWYEQAYPLLTGEAPASKLYVPRRHGEALVSMGVSYWSQDQKDLAIKLTVDGAEVMEQAVQAGVLDEKSLSVPYGNLATMHRRLGNEQESSNFAKLARNARGPVATANRSASPNRSTNGNSKRRARR